MMRKAGVAEPAFLIISIAHLQFFVTSLSAGS
jgi:hypothetical protein